MHAWLHNARYGLHKHTSRAAAGGPCPATRARTPKNTAPLVPCLPPARVAGRRLRLLHARARARRRQPRGGIGIGPGPARRPPCVHHAFTPRSDTHINWQEARGIYIYTCSGRDHIYRWSPRWRLAGGDGRTTYVCCGRKYAGDRGPAGRPVWRPRSPRLRAVWSPGPAMVPVSVATRHIALSSIMHDSTTCHVLYMRMHACSMLWVHFSLLFSTYPTNYCCFESI